MGWTVPLAGLFFGPVGVGKAGCCDGFVVLGGGGLLGGRDGGELLMGGFGFLSFLFLALWGGEGGVSRCGRCMRGACLD